jgi:hypothetical protein
LKWQKSSLDVLILSAKYGLLTADTPIEKYDQRMTQERALQLQRIVAEELDDRLTSIRYDEVFVNLGQMYQVALALSLELPCLGARVHYARGGIGEKMAQMKRWLHLVGQVQSV